MFRKFIKIEGAALIIAAPFLIFPFVFLPGSIISLLLIVWLWTRNWKNFEQVLPPTPFNLAFLLWGASIFIGMVVSKTPDVTIPKATGLILGLTLWRFVVIAVQNYGQLKAVTLLFILVGCGIMVGGLFVVKWYAKFPAFESFTALFPPQLFRLPGSPDFGVSPNQFAGTMLFFLPLTIVPLISWRFQKKYRKLTIFALAAGLFLALILFLTQSRSGWIGAVATVISIIVLYSGSSSFFKSHYPFFKRLLAACLVIGLLVGIWRFFSSELPQMMNLTIGELPPSTTYSLIFRKEVWRVGVQAASEFPLTGVGLGSFRDVFTSSYVSTIPPEIDIAHAHNTFLQVALDVGVPGLVAYLAILMIAFSIGWKIIWQNESLKPLAICMVAGLIGLHAYGLTDAISIGSKTHFVYWLVIGLLAGMWQMSKLGSVNGRQ